MGVQKFVSATVKHVSNTVATEQINRVMRKPTFWFPTLFDTNQAMQLLKMARGLKFRIYSVEGLDYLCGENKGVISFAVTAKLIAVTAKLICVFVFAYSKCWFSHDAAQINECRHCLHVLITRVASRET